MMNQKPSGLGCPICGGEGDDLVFAFYCRNKECANWVQPATAEIAARETLKKAVESWPRHAYNETKADTYSVTEETMPLKDFDIVQAVQWLWKTYGRGESEAEFLINFYGDGGSFKFRVVADEVRITFPAWLREREQEARQAQTEHAKD